MTADELEDKAKSLPDNANPYAKQQADIFTAALADFRSAVEEAGGNFGKPFPEPEPAPETVWQSGPVIADAAKIGEAVPENGNLPQSPGLSQTTAAPEPPLTPNPPVLPAAVPATEDAPLKVNEPQDADGAGPKAKL